MDRNRDGADLRVKRPYIHKNTSIHEQRYHNMTAPRLLAVW